MGKRKRDGKSGQPTKGTDRRYVKEIIIPEAGGWQPSGNCPNQDIVRSDHSKAGNLVPSLLRIVDKQGNWKGLGGIGSSGLVLPASAHGRLFLSKRPQG